MRSGGFSEEQMVVDLREADHEPEALVAKKRGINDANVLHCIWYQLFSGMSADG